MTDMEAKAREVRLNELLCASEELSLQVLTKALTEAHREGMEEAAKVADGYCHHVTRLCVEGKEDVCQVCLGAAAIREKIKESDV